ncbi:MAG: hypothetical protein WCF23_08250 [Candidatus Nitrosopolaris sp.]
MIKENNPTILQHICVAMMKLDKVPKNRDNAIEAAAVEADDKSYSRSKNHSCFLFAPIGHEIMANSRLLIKDFHIAMVIAIHRCF